MNNKIIEFEYAKYYKSKIIIGNITIYVEKKFNWVQRKMLKIFFGFDAVNLEEEVNK